MRKLAISLTLLLLGTTGARADEPRAPVERLHETLVQVMRGAEELGFEGRKARIGPVLAETYDLDWMAAKSLGRHWKKLSEEQRGRWQALFRELTAATYADRFDGYGGERFTVLGQETSGQGTILVHTRIERNDAEPVVLDYRVRPRSERYRIIDVYLEGTVSELALRRGDYSSLVKREGFDALVAAVNEKIAEARAGTDALE